MGKQIDLDSPLSKEDREYLVSRGRGYLLAANERRFGTPDKPKEPDEGDTGPTSQSPFYDSAEREKAIYDVGGAPLPGTVLDYDTGRVADRENGVIVEFTGPGHTPGASSLVGRREPEGFTSKPDEGEEGEDIDDDIVQKVLNLPNVTALKKELDKKKIAYAADDKREDLENRLAVALQDERDAKANQPGPQ